MLFELLSFLILLTALLVISTPNAVHSLFYLIAVFVQITVLLLVFFNLEFVPFLLIIVYVGAIAILFLFVIMMLDVNQPVQSAPKSFLGPFLILVVLIYGICRVLLAEDLGSVRISSNFLNSTILWESLVFYTSDLSAIANVLYSVYILPFLLVSFVLLIAMVGAISLTLKQKSYVKRQLLVKQIYSDFDVCIKKSHLPLT